MSSEEHLDQDTGELPECEVVLAYARSATVLSVPRSPTPDRLAGRYSRGLSAITKQLKELADHAAAKKRSAGRGGPPKMLNSKNTG